MGMGILERNLRNHYNSYTYNPRVIHEYDFIII